MRLQTSLGTRDPLTTHSRQLSPSSSLNLLPGCLYGFNDPGSIWFFIFINRVVQYDLHFWEYHLFARVKLCRSATHAHTHTHTHAHTDTHAHTGQGFHRYRQSVCQVPPIHSAIHQCAAVSFLLPQAELATTRRYELSGHAASSQL